MAKNQTQLEEGAAIEAASQALFHLGRLFARMPLREQLAQAPMHGSELSHILIVQAVEAGQATNREVTIGHVAVHLEIDPSTASRLVQGAVRSGYLVRVPSAQDGRAVQLELTPAGAQLAQAARRYQRAIFDRVTARWPNQERQRFAERFVDFVEELTALLVAQKRGDP